MKRRPKRLPQRPSSYDDRYPESPRGNGLKNSSGSWFDSTKAAMIGSVLIIGIAVGAFFGYSANFSNESVASRVVIEESVANPEICAQFGAGAIAIDLRAFVTLNPFKVFISQPLMQPGCVLRSNNWDILESRGLLVSDDIRDCKRRMNTFGFTGDIEQSGADPQIACVYENDAARNLFLENGGRGASRESDRF
ncbi:MAG: DUF3172 domain-containing protein [Cyanobacteria bacterium P01_A01_bin.37]